MKIARSWLHALSGLFLLLFVSNVAAESDVLLHGNTQPEGLQVSMYSEQLPLTINRMHRWVIRLHDSTNGPVSGAAITVDGGMPAHDHGLPTSPQVSEAEEAGEYWLDGMRFHMNGEWTLQLLIEHQGRRYRASFALQV